MSFDYPDEPEVQIRDLRWAPSLTGVLLATADYETLPAGPGSSTGTFLMQVGSLLPVDSACRQQSSDGGLRTWSMVFYATYELIPDS